MAVSKRVRYEVMRRDNHACRYCGAMAPNAKLTIDHVVPVALGGSDDPSNLVTACRDCNAGKTSTSPSEKLVDDVSALNVAFAAAMRQAAEELLPDDGERAYIAAFDTAWLDSQTWQDSRPANWEHSIGNFYRAGLPIEVLVQGIGRARYTSTVSHRDRFRYMCGFAWKKVDEIRARAAEIMAEVKPEHASTDDTGDVLEYGLAAGRTHTLHQLREVVVGQPDRDHDVWASPTLDPALVGA